MKTLGSLLWLAVFSSVALAQGTAPPPGGAPEAPPPDTTTPDPTTAPTPDPTTTPAPFTPMSDESLSTAPDPNAPVVAAASSGIASTGNFGIGVESTLGGNAGLAGRFQLSDMIGFYGVLRLATVTGDSGGTVYGIGGGVSYRWKTSDNGAMGFFGGADVFKASTSYSPGGPMGLDVTNFALGGGLQAEWYVDPRLSLHAQVGLAFTYTTGSSMDPTGGGDTSGTSLSIGADAMSSFGATFWWR